MSIFKLQQFSVKQTVSGMKICSDSLLFGALIPVEGVKRILDIGTGTGLLSLMQAQKCSALSAKTLESITAVEITAEGAAEAKENFCASPWHSLLQVVHQDIQSFTEQAVINNSAQYDLIICNPPFFSQHSPTQSENALRHIARHTDYLSFSDLSHSLATLLTKNGVGYLLVPVSIKQEIRQYLNHVGLDITAVINIAESEQHVAKVMVLKVEFGIDKKRPLRKADLEQTVYKFGLDGPSKNCHTHTVQQYLSPFLLRYKNGE